MIQLCQVAGHRTCGPKVIPRFRILGRGPQEIHRDRKSKPYAHFSSNRQGSSFYLRSYPFFPPSFIGGAIPVRVTLTRFNARPRAFGLKSNQYIMHMHLFLFAFISPWPSHGPKLL